MIAPLTASAVELFTGVAPANDSNDHHGEGWAGYSSGVSEVLDVCICHTDAFLHHLQLNNLHNNSAKLGSAQKNIPDIYGLVKATY